MRPGHLAQICRTLDRGEANEITNVVAIRPPRVLVVQVRKPLRFGRDVRKTVELARVRKRLSVETLF
jgi:hypothetical protein